MESPKGFIVYGVCRTCRAVVYKCVLMFFFCSFCVTYSVWHYALCVCAHSPSRKTRARGIRFVLLICSRRRRGVVSWSSWSCAHSMLMREERQRQRQRIIVVVVVVVDDVWRRDDAAPSCTEDEWFTCLRVKRVCVCDVSSAKLENSTWHPEQRARWRSPFCPVLHKIKTMHQCDDYGPTVYRYTRTAHKLG